MKLNSGIKKKIEKNTMKLNGEILYKRKNKYKL